MLMIIFACRIHDYKLLQFYREMILSTTSIKSGIQRYAAYLHVTMANF